LPGRIIIVLETTVLDRQTHQLINGAAVALHNTQRADTWRQLTLTNGKTYNILEQQQHYALTAGKTGYDTASDTFNTNIVTKSDTMRVTLYISQATLQPGTSFVLQNLYYDLDKSTIRPDAARVLDSLATVLAQHPAVRIELSSHTDSRASYTYNMQLSARRAQAAVAYLVKKGIAPGRLVARGYGETWLVNKCAKGVKCTEAEHQANRRTEVKILEQE
jgi:outer membrane protein OmpA-like peptidoglycan-associated protein